MQRPKVDVESALLKKGFRLEERKHHFFVYFTEEGTKVPVTTFTSHSKKTKELGDTLLSNMARQTNLTKQQFLDLIDCPLTRQDYERILRSKGVLDTIGQS